jgi:hypothetical protein
MLSSLIPLFIIQRIMSISNKKKAPCIRWTRSQCCALRTHVWKQSLANASYMYGSRVLRMLATTTLESGGCRGGCAWDGSVGEYKPSLFFSSATFLITPRTLALYPNKIRVAGQHGVVPFHLSPKSYHQSHMSLVGSFAIQKIYRTAPCV